MDDRIHKIYLCHEFNGIYDNVKRIVNYINKLATYNSNTIYISPILLFGNLYDDIATDLFIKYKLNILNVCDRMITFGDSSLGDECDIEKEYCDEHNIKIIDFFDYYKPYLGVDDNEQNRR